MSRRLTIIAAIPAALVIFACSETPFSFFDFGDPAFPPGSGGTGASCAGETCASGGTLGASGGLGGVAAAPSSGSAPSEGGAPPEPTDACLLPGTTLRAERIQVTDNNLCFSRGAFQLLLGEPSYAIKLAECSSDPAQIWVLTELSPKVFEARNYSVNLNLDTQFGAVDAGTPVDLYTPHQLYNQRFVVTELDDDTFKLSPLNAIAQCVSAWDGALMLRSCEGSLPGQSFRRLECAP